MNLLFLLISLVARHLHMIENILYITGAGVSAESGIPTFRGNDGFWTIGSVNYTPQEMATRHMYQNNPEEFLLWYLSYDICIWYVQYSRTGSIVYDMFGMYLMILVEQDRLCMIYLVCTIHTLQTTTYNIGIKLQYCWNKLQLTIIILANKYNNLQY